MVENKVNWNTVLVVLVIGVVGILLLNNSNLFSGKVTGVTSKIGNLDTADKQAVLSMLNRCRPVSGVGFYSCNNVCANSGKTCILAEGNELASSLKGVLMACDTPLGDSSQTVSCYCCS